MANSIQTMTDFSVKLDELYRKESLTSVLDSAPELVTIVGKEFKIPQMELDGLATHSRTDGGSYVGGGATLSFVTKTPDYDRNRKFTIDAMDDAETAGIAFGQLSGQFIKHKVTPEIDSVRFAKYSQVAGTKKAGTISTGAEFLTALREATTELDNNEVSDEGRILFATPALLNAVMALQTIDSREVLATFAEIVKVPQSRFYNAITLYDGKTSGQEDGGYVKAPITYAKTEDEAIDANKIYFTASGTAPNVTYTAVASPKVDDIATYYEADGGIELNFLIVQKEATIQTLKHVAPKYIPASVNQDFDGDSYAYRVYGICDFYNNKGKGIYVHKKV